jgi:hypothetical protein
MLPLDERIKRALTAEGGELRKMVRDRHPDVISNLILNRNLTEDMAVQIAKGRAATPEALGFLANDVRFRDSYKLKVAICRNPATPLRVALTLLKHIRIFDLSDITKISNININVRRKIEDMICEKIRSMPSGTKTALARRSNSAVLSALMEGGDERVIGACLESPALTEGQLYKLINAPHTKAFLIRIVAEHARWTARYQVRLALIKNFYTPMALVSRFIRDVRTTDLKELYHDPALPTSTRPFIFRELRERGENTENMEKEVFGLSEDEDLSLPEDDE